MIYKRGFVRGIYILIISFAFTAICNSEVKAAPISSKEYDILMKQDLLCLLLAYPDYIKDIKVKEENKFFIVMKSGRMLIYDDKKNKSLEEKLNNGDLQDMLEQVYPLEIKGRLMEEDFDPGRVRNYSLLNEVYGVSQNSVEANLINVRAGYRSFQFNKNNKAAEALGNVMKELTSMMATNKNIASFLYPVNGTFNYRLVAGTGRLSPHSYGIAIDLKSDRKDYWKWATKEEGNKRVSIYPKELVQCFERNNFIWGGKWSHFDILHFEYRPELIIKARYFNKPIDGDKVWYENAPYGDPIIKECIQKIDSCIN